MLRPLIISALCVAWSTGALANDGAFYAGDHAPDHQTTAFMATDAPYDHSHSGAPIADKPFLSEVETTGRVAFDRNRADDELRRMALSEALYLAALHGAADIRGFSAIDSETNLQEHVVVQPRGRVIDYTILDDGPEHAGPRDTPVEGAAAQDDAQKPAHYAVRIRAVIGNPQSTATSCHRQAPRKITIFKPQISVDPNLPAWVAPAVGKSLAKVIRDIKAHPQVDLTFAMSTELKPQQIRQQSPDMTYASLMSSTAIAPGEYALVPELVVTSTRARRFGVADASYAQMTLRLALYHGPTLQPVNGDHDKMQALNGVTHSSRIALHSFWDNVDLILNRHRDQEIRSLVSGLGDISLRTVDGLACQPLQAQLARQGAQFYVPMGRRHGIENRQLGIIPSQDGGWVVARVMQLEADRAIIEPLDTRKSLAQFVGNDIRFMETH